MKTLLYANRSEPKSISVISILLLAAVGDITKLRCMHRECYIFASQNLCYNVKLQLKIDHNEIRNVEKITFLGIIIDNKLDWNSQIHYVCTKLSRYITILNKVKFKLNS